MTRTICYLRYYKGGRILACRAEVETLLVGVFEKLDH